MKMDAELNSSTAGETGGQSQVRQSSVAGPLGSEAATPAAAADAASGEGSLAAGARDEGGAKAAIERVEPSFEAKKISSAGKSGRDNQVGDPSVAIASCDVAAVDPLGDALAALDRRDYATAQRLFEALGRKDAAEAIRDALAALDRKDYATAQGLFEALSLKDAAAAQVKGSAPATLAPPPKPVASAAGPLASDSWDKVQQPPAISPPEGIPFGDASYRRPVAQAEKAIARRLKPLLLGTGFMLIAIVGASAIYGSPLNWTFATAKSQAIAGLSSAVDVLKARLEAITGSSGREDERSAMRDLSAALTQVTIRLDQIEHEYGARLDELGQRIDQNSSSRSAEIAARLDALEKKAAAPAAPASELAGVVARLDKLEKRIVVAAVSSAKPLPPPAPKQPTFAARAEPPASDEIARLDNSRPLLRDYSVEDVQGGVAVIDSRYGV